MKTENSKEKPGWELLAKYLAREATDSEQKEVEKWADLAEENRRELEQTRLLLEKTDWFYQLKTFDSGKAWKKIHPHIRPENPLSARYKNLRNQATKTFYKYAAIIIIALMLGSAGYFIGFNNQLWGAYSEISSPENEVLNEYVLPDGSVVALNSNSKLHFPKKFKNNSREVTITGEAFFDVKPDPDNPFIINAGNAQVKVLGTAFNVCAYPETETVEVVVESGSVQVLSVNNEKPDEISQLLLNTGEKGTLFNTVNRLEKTLNTDPNYLAWKTNNLIFNETPLWEVAEHLEKIYHIDIEMEEDTLENLALTAEFENESLHFILDVVKLTFDLELSERNGQYILSDEKTIEIN